MDLETHLAQRDQNRYLGVNPAGACLPHPCRAWCGALLLSPFLGAGTMCTCFWTHMEPGSLGQGRVLLTQEGAGAGFGLAGALSRLGSHSLASNLLSAVIARLPITFTAPYPHPTRLRTGTRTRNPQCDLDCRSCNHPSVFHVLSPLASVPQQGLRGREGTRVRG